MALSICHFLILMAGACILIVLEFLWWSLKLYGILFWLVGNYKNQIPLPGLHGLRGLFVSKCNMIFFRTICLILFPMLGTLHKFKKMLPLGKGSTYLSLDLWYLSDNMARFESDSLRFQGHIWLCLTNLLIK